MSPRAVALSLSLAGLALTPSADAQARRAFELTPSVDVPVMAVTAPFLGVWFLSGELRPAWCAPRCDPSTLNALDRPAAGVYRPRWRTASDLSVLGFGLGAMATLAVAEGLPRSLGDTVVVLESTMVSNALAILTNYAVGRPRPYAYGDSAPEERRARGVAAQSFFSGHTANAFAVAVATFQVLRRVARPAVAYTALGVGLAAASFIGLSRVLAGDHFPSDVVAGAVVGASMGWLVPALHRTAVRPVPVALERGAGLALVGAL